MTKITESEIEKIAIELLEKQGYQYIYAPVIALIAKNAEGKLP
jgi:type I restriction enzyme R subunit